MAKHALRGGISTAVVFVVLDAATATRVYSHCDQRLGGLVLQLDGLADAVVAHLHTQANAPFYLFTLRSRRPYKPSALARFIQQQPQFFYGMQLQWMGLVATDGSRVVTSRADGTGAALPDLPLPHAHTHTRTHTHTHTAPQWQPASDTMPS
jgi:hypothetical protein